VTDKDLQLMTVVIVDDTGFRLPVCWCLARQESEAAYFPMFSELSRRISDTASQSIGHRSHVGRLFQW